MGPAIAQMIPFALGKMIAVNPTIAVILLLVSVNGNAKALAFVVGAFVGPLIAGLLLLPLADMVSTLQVGDVSMPLNNVLELVAGLTFLFLAGRTWFRRTKRKVATAPLPGWMQVLDRVNTIESFGLGAVMTVFGVKNLLMLVGMIVAMGRLDLGMTELLIVLVVFVLISTLPVAAPLVVDWYLGARAEAVLSQWKAWLVQNNDLIAVGVLFVLGVFFTYRGVVGLIDVAS